MSHFVVVITQHSPDPSGQRTSTEAHCVMGQSHGPQKHEIVNQVENCYARSKTPTLFGNYTMSPLVQFAQNKAQYSNTLQTDRHDGDLHYTAPAHNAEQGQFRF